MAAVVYHINLTEVERQILLDALGLAIEQDIFTDRIEDATASLLYEEINLLPEGAY